MKERVLTGTMIFLIILFAILIRQFSVYVFDAFVLVLMLGAAWESSNLFAKMGMYNNKKATLIYPILLYGLFLLLQHKSTNLLWAIIYNLALIIGILLVVFLVQLILKKKTDNEIKTRNFKGSKYNFMLLKSIQTTFSMLYPSLLLFAFVLLNHISSLKTISSEVASPEIVGFIALASVFLIAALTDTFSMLFGRLIGGKKLAPKISPNKTVSGTVGGIIMTMLIMTSLFLVISAFENANILFYTINLQLWHIVLLTLITGVFCNLGDLFESFLKRRAKVKDSGTIFPGHGGILDRFDSHSLAAVVVLIFFIILL